MTFSILLQAFGLFVATNIDDVIILALFFARAGGAPGSSFRITAGQYLGFVGILVASIATTAGAGMLLSPSVIPYFGLVPLVLGIKAAWDEWNEEEDENVAEETGTKGASEAAGVGKIVSIASVAGVTFANGGDNIGVYVPVFLSQGWAATVTYSLVFLVLVGALVYIAHFVATQPTIAKILERWESVLFPLVLIGLGIAILVSGGAFGL
ncbi:cadmium resistance transporter [Arcanobacterium ihumii]|uniref:cadmium resistance transporter n=1 Tax=Arcanobacterium ihumii TaxID=2138162 RepID=UPI000F52394E|nr:cadmium resistance transporter [Arcanobacterium ihumii]